MSRQIVALTKTSHLAFPLVGSCGKSEHPEAPMLTAEAYFENVESFGCGTIAHDPENGELLPHLHISVGSRLTSATAHTSHFLNGKIQLLVEMVLVEVLSPSMERVLSKLSFYEICNMNTQ